MAQLVQMNFWSFLMVAAVAWISIEALVYFFHKPESKPTLTIIGATDMADLGKPFLFTVVAKNSSGVSVPDTTITATTDNGTVTVNSDGTAGVLTPATVGTANLTATDGKLTATLAVPVVDNVPASLTIVPT